MKKTKNIKLEETVLKALAIQAVYSDMNLQNYIEAILVSQSKTPVITISNKEDA
ncbi:MAG: hypothetical protein JWQ09_5811 [Segetibacter sp.]|nr:hypothetical protein [Segetibacter sp.]